MIRHWTEWNAYAKRHHLLLFELAVTPEGMCLYSVHNVIYNCILFCCIITGLLGVRADRAPTDIMTRLETDCPGMVDDLVMCDYIH